MAAGRCFIRWWWLGCALTALPLLAQDRPTSRSTDDRGTAPSAAQTDAAPSSPPDKPAPAVSSASREFKPSEEVSPDQEVDFPADL